MDNVSYGIGVPETQFRFMSCQRTRERAFPSGIYVSGMTGPEEVRVGGVMN